MPLLLLLLGAALVSPGPVRAAPARIVVGTDTNSPSPQVKAFTSRTQTTVASFPAYTPTFTGGVRVAAGDVNGDGAADIITGAGPGGGPHVKVFSGRDQAELHSFLAFEPTFNGGVFVAAGDINGDGFVDIVVGVGEGGGAQVKVFSGKGGELILSFIPYPAEFKGGVFVATGDVNGDGHADIITGAGPGGAPHVKVFDSETLKELQSFLAYTPSFAGGVNIAVGDVNGDGYADIITGAGAGGGPHVKVFDGLKQAEIASFFAYDAGFLGGVRVAAGDLDGDGFAELVTSPGSGALSHIRIWDGLTQTERAGFTAYESTYLDGVHVAVASLHRARLDAALDRDRTHFRLSWPAGERGGIETSRDLGDPRGWTLIDEQPVETDDQYQIAVPIQQAPQFFRLAGDDEAIPPQPR